MASSKSGSILPFSLILGVPNQLVGFRVQMIDLGQIFSKSSRVPAMFLCPLVFLSSFLLSRETDLNLADLVCNIGRQNGNQQAKPC